MLRLKDEEAHLMKEALLTYISDFGHDEAEIRQHAYQVLAKVESARTAPAVNVRIPSASSPGRSAAMTG
jgi:hypothetical protein